jgi:serine/threonine protein kinase
VLQLGKRLGDFEIIRLLGKGGMGEVYEARQLNPLRSVALKVLAPWLSQNPQALDRFWQEAAVPAQLDHPGIVRIISTGQTDDGTAFYTMHLVRGISLAALIKKSSQTLPSTAAVLTTPPNNTPTTSQPFQHSPDLSGEAPVGEPPPGVLEAYCSDRFHFVARIGAKAARALADAHHRGYLHRDIKPSNLMIDHHDQVYLVDFGLTRALNGHGGTTQPGILRGTPWYMSPEQARGEALDERSDIYSLGVTLYEMLSEGKGPFTANRDNSEAVLAQVRAGLLRPLGELVPEIPHHLEKIVSKAMHFKPRKRFLHMEAFAEALEGVAGLTPRSSSRSRTQPQRPPVRRWPLFAATLGLLLLALGLLVGMAWMNRDRGKDDAPQQAQDDPEHPYPAMLREREWNTPVPLLTRENDTVWHRRLSGDGALTPHPQGLILRSMEGRTFLALDDDPKRRDFELALELQQDEQPPGQRFPNNLGVFFGWRERAIPGGMRPRFFLVELDERPVTEAGITAPHGRLRIETAQIEPRSGDRSAITDLGRPLLPVGKGYPLTKSGRAWHKVAIRVAGDRLRIKVDEAIALDASVNEIRRADPLLESTEPHGALGVWVQEGGGTFRNITTTALPRANGP